MWSERRINEKRNFGIKKHKTLHGPDYIRRRNVLQHILNKEFPLENGEIKELKVMILTKDDSIDEDDIYSCSYKIREL